MGRIHRAVAVALTALVVTGCATPASNELTELRHRFVAAGGTCSSWTPRDESFAVAASTCEAGATLVIFDSTKDRADFIKSEIETNDQIRARTHIILSQDTWLVIDTLAVIVRVMPAMGGMISGRNGANP